MSKFDEYLKIAKEKTCEKYSKNQAKIQKNGGVTRKKPMSRKDAILRTIKRDFSVVSFKKYTHIFAFPLVFVYFELMLRICSGTSLFAHLIYPVLFGIATGFFVSFVTILFKRDINRKISIGILFVTAFIFTAECLIKRSFQWYMPIAGILGGAGESFAFSWIFSRCNGDCDSSFQYWKFCCKIQKSV